MQKFRKASTVLVTKQLNSYSQETSIHGIKYIAANDRHWAERVLWLLLCVASIVFGCFLSYPVLMKWVNFPTITTILQTNFPISEIPFPAVTICSNNKVFSEKLLDTINDEEGPLKGAMNKMNLGEDDFSEALTGVLRRYIYFIEEKDLEYDIKQDENIDQLNLVSNYSSKMTDVLKSVMLSCDELLVACQWQGKMKNCKELFSLTKSDSGFCCSFNLIDTDNLLKGSKKELKSDEDESEGLNEESTSLHDENRLQKSKTANSLLGLTVLLNGNKNEYTKWPVWNLAKNGYYGFKVLVHSPYDFPEVSGKGLALDIGKEAFVAVSGEYIHSSDKVKAMTYDRRKCLYYGEDASGIPESFRPEAFEEYTMINCLLECDAKRIMEECGCLPYYYPNFKQVWNQETSCNITGLQCLADKYLNLRSKSIDLNESSGCQCPEDCDKTSYFPEISQGAMIPERVIHWLTTREHPNGPTGNKNEILDVISLLEENDWSGVNEDGDAIEWDGWNLETCLREWDDGSFPKFCSYLRRRAIVAGDLSLMHVYFKETHMRKYLKEENFGTVDAIAAFGGIVGLCMGFSLLSLAEFLYFFSIRLFADRFRRNGGKIYSVYNSTKSTP